MFQFLERYARAQHVALAARADGGIKFWTAEKPARHAGALEEGRNMLRAEAEHDWRGRHSHYAVRGQRALGTSLDAMEIEAVARDETVPRWRPTIIVVEEDIDDERAKKRARTHRDRAAGRSLSARVHVQGFRDDAGTPWEPGRLIHVHSPALAITQDMLIETVRFEQDNGGSKAELSLVDARAYAGKAGRGSKSGESWKQDDSEAEATPAGQASVLGDQ